MGLVPLVGDTAAGGRDGIFVSYSHHDAVWAQRFRKVLKPLVRSKRLWLWVDTDIPVGDQWHPDIRRAIGRSSVALLLVSADFLDSDFIMDEELPALIRQGVRLAPVLVGDCLWKHVPELAQVEWLHSDSALNLVANKPGQRDRRLREICDRLIAMMPDARESRSQDHDPPPLPADSVLGYDRSYPTIFEAIPGSLPEAQDCCFRIDCRLRCSWSQSGVAIRWGMLDAGQPVLAEPGVVACRQLGLPLTGSRHCDAGRSKRAAPAKSFAGAYFCCPSRSRVRCRSAIIRPEP